VNETDEISSYSGSFLPVERSSVKAELVEFQRQKFESAMSNLIKGTTAREDFPSGKIPKKPARGGARVDYLPGWWFIEQLNTLFNYNWDFLVLDQGVYDNKFIWVKGQLVVRGANGTVVTKTQFGGSAIKRGRDGGPPISVGDDYKSASTDSMKKCATQLGLAADVYGRREILEEGAPNTTQLDTLYTLGEKVGKTRDEVDAMCKEKNDGKKPNEVETIVVLGLMNELRKLPKKD